ncbi:hypothetical protein ACWEV4_33860 [Streptomyces sp. NPDC003860]
MRRRSATVLALTALTVLALPGCSTSDTFPATAASDPVRATDTKAATGAPEPARVLTSAQLRERLLDEDGLGQGYIRKPERNSGRDDVTVIGCPALEKLGGDAAAGGSLDFPNRAKAAFTYTGSADSEVSQELYSDTKARLSAGTERIFDAMVSCPVYQVVVSSTPVKVGTQKVPAPGLGDEQWSQLLTFTTGGRESIVKQTAVRAGTVLVVISGSPALVDTHIEKALAKAALSA